MAQSVWMEPLKLQPYEISREMFVPFAFRYKLKNYLLRMSIAIFVLAAASFFINPNAPLYVLFGGASVVALTLAKRHSNLVTGYGSALNRAAFERRHVEFDDEELRIRTERNARTFVPFACLARVQEHPDRFLIFITAAQSWMIPKTAFPDVQTMAEFRELARRNNLFK